MDDSELVKRGFNIRKVQVVKIAEDLTLCDIQMDEKDIQNIKKYSFKKLVN